MNLHNQRVEIGDKVYDLLEGEGSVIDTDNDTQLTVKFSGQSYYSYNSTGQRMGGTPSRFPPLLYWQNPIVMIPVKGDKKWNAMKTLFFNAYNTIKGL